MKIRLVNQNEYTVSAVNENYVPGMEENLSSMDIVIKKQDNADNLTIEDLKEIFLPINLGTFEVITDDGENAVISGYTKLQNISNYMADDVSNITVRLAK